MQGIRIEPVKVFVIAPAIFSWGLERLVQQGSPHLELTGSAVSPAAAQDIGRSDVVIAACESRSDFEQLVEFKSLFRQAVLVVTGSQDLPLLDKAVLAGARGIVRTCEAPGVLLKAIEKVHEGELWIDRGATSRIFLEMARQKAAQGDDPEKTKIATLTTRERQTIAAVAGDASAPAKVIARRLCISEHTLRNHLTSIYSKLDLTNRLDLYAYATRHRLIEPPTLRG